MSITDAKKIPISQLLQTLGYNPIKSQKGGEELLYKSPLRQEREPSFYVNIKKNLWNDFGYTGGSILDFLMLYKNISLSEAVKYLEKFNESDFKHDLKSNKDKDKYVLGKKEKTLKIIQKKPFKNANPSLLRYICEERKILLPVAEKYLQEISFLNTASQKEYFAAGFENSAGGFELRNPYFKGSINGKAISLIQGSERGEELLIFEGFINFLSRLSQDNMIVPERDCLILNSAIYIDEAVNFIAETTYKKVFGFLDNDAKGEELSLLLSKQFPESFEDCRFIYKDYNDLNDYLKSL